MGRVWMDRYMHLSNVWGKFAWTMSKWIDLCCSSWLHIIFLLVRIVESKFLKWKELNCFQFQRTTAPTFTNVRTAGTAMLTSAGPPTTAPIAGCYCPYLNLPSAMTTNYLANLNAWWQATWTNPAGYFAASFTNGTGIYCASISTCPSGTFNYAFVVVGWKRCYSTTIYFAFIWKSILEQDI